MLVFETLTHQKPKGNQDMSCSGTPSKSKKGYLWAILGGNFSSESPQSQRN